MSEELKRLRSEVADLKEQVETVQEWVAVLARQDTEIAAYVMIGFGDLLGIENFSGRPDGWDRPELNLRLKKIFENAMRLTQSQLNEGEQEDGS